MVLVQLGQAGPDPTSLVLRSHLYDCGAALGVETKGRLGFIKQRNKHQTIEFDCYDVNQGWGDLIALAGRVRKLKIWCVPHKILGNNIVLPKFYRRLPGIKAQSTFCVHLDTSCC